VERQEGKEMERGQKKEEKKGEGGRKERKEKGGREGKEREKRKETEGLNLPPLQIFLSCWKQLFSINQV